MRVPSVAQLASILALVALPAGLGAQDWPIITVPRPGAADGSCLDPSVVVLTGLGFDVMGPVVGWSDACEAVAAGTPAIPTNMRWITRTESDWAPVGVLLPPGGMEARPAGARLAVSPTGVPFYAYPAQSTARHQDNYVHYWEAWLTDLGTGTNQRIDLWHLYPDPRNPDHLLRSYDDSVDCVDCNPHPTFGLGFDLDGSVLAVRGTSRQNRPARLLRNRLTLPALEGPPPTSYLSPDTDLLEVGFLDYAARAVGTTLREALVYAAVGQGLSVIENGVRTTLPEQPLRLGTVSVAIDPAGHAHVAVAGYKTADACVAPCTETTPKLVYYTNASGAWAPPTVLALDSSTAAIAVDSRGRPCVAYWRSGTDPETDGLRYACAEMAGAQVLYTSWTASVRIGAAFERPNSGTVRLAFDDHDSPYVLSFDADSNQIELACQDGTPPITTASDVDGSRWYNQSVLVTLTARDPIPGSGVDRIEYIVVADDGTRGPQTTLPVTLDPAGNVTGEIKFSEEGLATLVFWAVDRNGNVEAPNSLEVKIDRTPPDPPRATFTTSSRSCPICATAPYASDTWARAEQVDSSEFTCIDPAPKGVTHVSGIATCPPPVTATSEGVTRFEPVARDAAGNVSATLVEVVKLDRTPPVFATTPVDPADPSRALSPLTRWTWNGYPWWNRDIAFRYESCSDPAPGAGARAPGALSYQRVGSGLVPGSCPAGTVSPAVRQEGVFYAGAVTDPVDQAGNRASTSQMGGLDKTNPRAAVRLATIPAVAPTTGNAGTAANPSNDWYRSPVPVDVLNCYDPKPASNPSGLQSGIDPASDCTDSTGSYAGSSRRHTLTVPDGVGRTFDGAQRVSDKAGNRADAVPFTVNVDTTPPEISCSVVGTFSGTPYLGRIYGADGAQPGSGDSFHWIDLTVSVSVTDALSGPGGMAPYFSLDYYTVVDTNNPQGGCFATATGADPDVLDLDTGPAKTHFRARRELCSTGSGGRVYRFVYSAVDRAGNRATRNCDFTVEPRS